jgi:hypothetical protein
LAQEHQQREGELQSSPVPDDVAQESEMAPQTEDEHDQAD